MGYKKRTEQETTHSNNSSSLSEALLFATMCIIGLPVDVYIKDGSVYSGIFYTASVEKDYGIVLKKAKMSKKGKSNANVANGTVIETLVILSADLVQVVAKGVQLPADGIAGNFAGDDVVAVAGTVPPIDGQISEAKRPIRSGLNKRRNQKRISVRNENGYFHGDGPIKAEKEHEEQMLSLKNMRNAMEVEHGKRDRMDVTKIEEASVDSVNGRQVGDKSSQGQQDSCTRTTELHKGDNVDGVQGSSTNFVEIDRDALVRLPHGVSMNSMGFSFLFGLDMCPSISPVAHHNFSTLLAVGACQGPVMPAEEHPNMAFKHSNGVSHDPAHELDKPENQCRERPTSADTSSQGAARSTVSTSSTPVTDVTSGLCFSSLAASTEVVPLQSAPSNKSTKEFKLNPGAKIFSPSSVNPVSATSPAIPTATSMAYVPSNSPVLPIAAAQSEVGVGPYLSHSSVPSKFVPYGTLTAANGGSAAQFSQPIVGHAGRSQPVRYAGQYPVQAGPTYVHPSSQADLGVAAMSPVSARPALTPHQVQFPKHQGNAAGQALQLCIPSPMVAGGLQPFPVPSHIPVLQPPIPANRPIPVPGSNGLYSTKFP
ncbi:SM-ATX domain-containing protein [Citrus sinensis]|uniref:SM-ATX domain-containing protein n=1 Tax=Citrus sinensis TaxID=2711 RepID=A0ACB8NZL5_CITSI|nr:SM-ATX domain-containing protein [Citrus sinensis]